MSKLRTKSFDLAIRTAGNPESEWLLVFGPGRGDSKDDRHISSHLETVASLGVFAVSLDPPGMYESGGDITDYTMTNYRQAMFELIDYYNNRRTILSGHSRGGGIAMLLGPEHTAVVAYAAIMSRPEGSPLPSADVKDEVKYREDPLDPSKKVEIHYPASYFIDAEQHNALPGLADCHKSKLFLYGRDDSVVKPEVVIAAHDAAHGPKEIYEIASEHDYRHNIDAINEVDKRLSYFVWPLVA